MGPRPLGSGARRLPSGPPASFDRLGQDLRLDVAASTGPVVLVGPSIGGMTTMALAERHHEYVAGRVAGAAFRAISDLHTGVLRWYAFGSPKEVAPGARFAERLIESVPLEVVAEFSPAFRQPRAGRRHSRPTPGLRCWCSRGGDDVTLPEPSEGVAAALSGAELVSVPGAGHLVLCEAPGPVNAHLARWVTRSIENHETAVSSRGER